MHFALTTQTCQQGYFTWTWAPSQLVVNHSCFVYEMRTWLQLEMRQKPAHPDFLILINNILFILYTAETFLKVIVQFYFGFRKYVWLLSSQISSCFCCLILVMSLPVSHDIYSQFVSYLVLLVSLLVMSINVIVGAFVFVFSPLPVVLFGWSPLTADWLTKLSIIVRRRDVNLSASS